MFSTRYDDIYVAFEEITQHYDMFISSEAQMLVLAFSDAVFLHTRQHVIDSIRPLTQTAQLFSLQKKNYKYLKTHQNIFVIYIYCNVPSQFKIQEKIYIHAQNT